MTTIEKIKCCRKKGHVTSRSGPNFQLRSWNRRRIARPALAIPFGLWAYVHVPSIDTVIILFPLTSLKRTFEIARPLTAIAMQTNPRSDNTRDPGLRTNFIGEKIHMSVLWYPFYLRKKQYASNTKKKSQVIKIISNVFHPSLIHFEHFMDSTLTAR